MLDTCRRAGGGQATVRWTTDDTLSGYGSGIVQPRDGSDDGVFSLSCARALAAGFVPRPLFESARDLIQWARLTDPSFSSPH
jgi:2'-hydroxyisoflavone reductase